jgi:hypothetical protein
MSKLMRYVMPVRKSWRMVTCMDRAATNTNRLMK